MSIRAARVFGVFWVGTVVAVLASGFVLAGTEFWRERMSVDRPTGEASAAYVEHGRTYYAPPGAVRWRERMGRVYPWMLLVFAGTSAVGFVIVPDEAVGRRW
jgi:hypothetical protein